MTPHWHQPKAPDQASVGARVVWSGGEGLYGRPRPVSLAPTLEHPHPRATMKAHPSTPRRPIDSNKIDLMPQLRSLLGLGPLAWLTLALGVASLLTRLQDLWRGRSDPGGIDKGHLRLEAVTSPNEADLALQASQMRPDDNS